MKILDLLENMQSMFSNKSTTDHIRFCFAKSNRSRKIIAWHKVPCRAKPEEIELMLNIHFQN